MAPITPIGVDMTGRALWGLIAAGVCISFFVQTVFHLTWNQGRLVNLAVIVMAFVAITAIRATRRN